MTDLATGATAAGLASSLTGSGVTVSNVTYTGSTRAAGSFTSGDNSIVGFGSGIVLSSGKVETYPSEVGTCSKGVEGPNVCYDTLGTHNSTDFGLPGDPDLDVLASPNPTFDAAVLQFDFVPTFSTVQFKYVFGSEEYSDFANTQFDDVFGFFVNGTNCALVPGTNQPVSVNTINNGNPHGDTTPHNVQFFRDNVYPNGPTINTELNGLTTVLTCNATVNPGVTNHIKLAVADTSDGLLDSAVFIEGGSLISGTQVTTSLSGGGGSGATISVGSGTPVTDQATLSGANAGQAAGTVSYKVYTDANCTNRTADLGSVAVTGGVVLPSAAFTASTAGTYYWQASYSGDALNNASTSTCGAEVEKVTAPTTLSTSLSGGGKTGTAITVPAGTPVTDSAALSGAVASSATGSVTYNVYSDAACSQLVSAGSAEAITTAGTFPPSQVVTLSTPGTYYWQASYTGDATNAAATSTCGAGGEVETVTPPVLPTALTTSLSGGGKTGTAITVPAGTAVTDAATLSGTNAPKATGTVTYNVYSDSACTKPVKVGAAQTITAAGTLPKSATVTLTTAGKFFWTAAYSGDATNKPSASTCGAETVTVTPLPSFDTMTTAVGRSAATARVTTTGAGDLLVALVAGRGPAAGGQAATVSGGGVTWHLAGRENAGRGDVEVWTATAGGILNGVSVKATAKVAGFTVTMTVQAFKHATGTGALAKATAASGAPKATLKTANNDAWVLAMADDWAHAVTPKPAAGQFVVSRVTDTTDTFWAQAASQMVVKAGTSVTISDSAPTTDPFDLIVVEVH